jgi:hypothetical protein
MAGGQRLISWHHPCSTSNVALNTRTCAHGPLMGHPNWARCDIHPPSKNPASSSVQLTCSVPTHTPCRLPHPRPTRVCICPHTDPIKCPGTFPLNALPYISADPYAMPCVPSQAHTCLAPYVRTLTCKRNPKLQIFNTCDKIAIYRHTTYI